VHYQLVTPPSSRTPTGKVEVIEFLWYGCETCYVIQPHLQRWADRRRDSIDYRRIPAVTNNDMILLARAFYTAEALGISDKVHHALFDAIHKHGRTLKSEQDLAEFFEEQGVERDDFRQAFRSNYVAGMVRKARTLGSRYGIAGAPTIVIDGKYRVDTSMVVSPQELIAVIDYLVNKESGKES
jgi:thiol:disulfide interchange protein DsbA